MTELNKKPIKALISTIQPIDGGVPSMTRWICKLLEEYGISPVLAWYAPWSNYPELSVPIYRSFIARPKANKQIALETYEGFGIGSWLPEFEFTHYLPSNKWKSLIHSCQLHIVVSGNPLAATPYVFMKVPFIAWVATPWEADRKNRIKEFGAARKTLDTVINKPILSRLERIILRSKNSRIISLSKYTSNEFERISQRSMNHVMLMPVNTRLFIKDVSKTIKWRVGFSGRYSDPRKNIRLLLHATKLLLDSGYPIELVLVGDKHKDVIRNLISDFHLTENVQCISNMPQSELASILQSFDVFVIPSHQEGLCISALEAMACGVPVISTRCGGPEEFVLPDRTGELTCSTPFALSAAITKICANRHIREKLSKGALEWVELNASEDLSRKIFRDNLLDFTGVRDYNMKTIRAQT